MDDLYQNAWSETTDVTPTFNAAPRPSWSSPSKVTSSYDEEADLAAPSWSTGAGIQWDEPSGSPGISWSLADGDAGWGASTYEGITLGKSPADAVQQDIQHETQEKVVVDSMRDVSPIDTPEANNYVALAPSPERPTSSLPSSPAQASSPEPSLSPASPKAPLSPTVPTSVPEPLEISRYDIAPELAAPPSPDGFGTFESGPVEEADVDDADADPWGASAWADTKQAEDEDEPVVDEWERAKQEKAKQDRRVPPELLANILAQGEELSREICPDPKEKEAISEEDAWRNDRRSGMEGVPGLSTFSDTFLPPLSLQPLVRFSQAQVAKKMASSVKLTKNLPITRGSPMSHYLAAKGSTAWEISVKERKEVVEDDVPVGWRIVEKAPTAPASDTAKDKKSGLFSFWGRRQSQVATTASTVLGADNGSRSTSIDKPESPIANEVKGESKRGSQDSVRSSATSSVTQLPPPSIEPSPVIPFPAAPISSYSSAPDPVVPRSSTPPPSAVSRFLNRFSRRGGGASPRSSLALSSDDLDFLSDVPSANDDGEDDPTDALEKFVSETVVPILPPPLAPPPKAPPLRPISAASSSSGAGSKLNSPATSAANDLDVLFGSFGSEGATSVPPNASQPSLPSLATPFNLAWSNTPSSAPEAGPSKHHSAPVSSSSQPSSSPLQTKASPLNSFVLPPPPSFKPIAPSVLSKSKPTLSSPFAHPPTAAQVEPRPMSASSTSSRTSYQTAAESEPPSPSSALPLGELYPHLVTPNSTPQKSASVGLSESKGSTFQSGSFEGETPMASTFSKSSFSTTMLRAPSQAHSSKSPTIVPLTSNLFDDEDDFSDFQSPVEQSSHASPPVPPPIAKSPRTLAAANAANAKTRNPPPRSQTLPTLSSFALSPPSASFGASAASLKPNLATLDGDDFADFHSSPLSSFTPPSTSSTSLFSNSTSDKALLTPKHKPSSSGDFNDSFASSLATPSPPRVPTKPTAVSQPPRLSPPKKAIPAIQPPPLQPPPGYSSAKTVPPLQPPPPFQRPSSQTARPPSTATPISPTNGPTSATTLLNRRRSQKAEHMHTLSLLELAATKSGQRWPAPASPLPAAIPGPDRAPPKQLFNIMDDVDEDPPGPISTAAVQPPSGSSFLPPPPTLNPSRPSSGLGMIGVVAASRSATSSPAPPTLEGLAPMHTGSSVLSAGASAPASDPLFDAWDFGGTTTNGTGNGSAFGAGGKAKPANGAKKAGGLSAQDLSFFEGL